MIREPSRLSEAEYDLLVVGGGIYGICAAWDAAMRGLSVAIVERADFCSKTSANPLKIVHGGFRYLQHANIKRMRQSIHERNVLSRVAPHLVHPLPFLIPTYGWGMQGKEILWAALGVYNLIAWDRNKGVSDPAKQIPWGEVFSRKECLERFPGLESKGMTGAIAFYDAQMYNPIRLALSYLKSAVAAGAVAVNYMEVTELLRHGDRVVGAKVRDVRTGGEEEVRAKTVLNTSGPWTERVLGTLGVGLRAPMTFTKDLYLIFKGTLDPKYALAVQSEEEDTRAIASRGKRHFFFIPWRGHTLVGSSHVDYNDDPDRFVVTEDDIQTLIDDVNAAYPISLTRKDISKWNSGMVPCGDVYGSNARIIDHRKEDGIEGLITITSVRWTVSRYIASKAVDLVLRKLDRKAPRSPAADVPVFGGNIVCFEDFVKQATAECADRLPAPVVRGLLHVHGAEYGRVVKHLDEDPSWAAQLDGTPVIAAEVIHAVREEMAQTLGDVVFRRTELGTADNPSEAALQACASVMAAELGWDEARKQQELTDVEGALL